MNSHYKLIGVINRFNINPNFVYPILEKDNKYYFQCISNNIIISFKEVPDKLHEKIIHLSDITNTNLINIKDNYTIGDDFIIAFQINKDTIFISDTTNFIPFINDFETDDHFLRDEIDNFLNKSKKTRIKIK